MPDASASAPECVAMLAAALSGDDAAQKAFVDRHPDWVFARSLATSGVVLTMREQSTTGGRRAPKDVAKPPKLATPPMPANVKRALQRLSKPGTVADMGTVLHAALSHVGNEYDTVHEFLCRAIGVSAVNVPYGQRALVLSDPGTVTFGLTGEGQKCDATDIACAWQ